MTSFLYALLLLLTAVSVVCFMPFCIGFITGSVPVRRCTMKFSIQRNDDLIVENVCVAQLSRKQFFSKSSGVGGTATLFVGLLSSSLATTSNAIDEASSYTIGPCPKSINSSNNNCVSTASVKMVDLYMSPWTWPEGVSVEEVVGRLKGVVDADSTLQLSEISPDKLYFRVRATRNFNTDEIEFVINPRDRVITYKSQQVEGPDNVSDFGGNRKRIEDIRKRIPFLSVMGADFESADAGPREGISGQLKAFWGLQSGGGYEKLLLDDYDEEDF